MKRKSKTVYHEQQENLLFSEIIVPDHKKQLAVANKTLDIIQQTFRRIAINCEFKTSDGGIIHDNMYDDTIKILLYVADLSLPIFNLMDKIERKHYTMNKDNHNLARKLFLEEYRALHVKYDTIKNRCYQILSDIDKEYYKQTKKYPPNMNKR
jgi:hypothetical protein